MRDENPAGRTAYITIALIALNVIAFVFWEKPFGANPVRETEFFYCNALIPYEVMHQENLVEAGRRFVEVDGIRIDLAQACPRKSWLLSVFVAMFLHGGWLHLGGNMLFLWVFGNNVEDKLGHIPYLLFYLAAGVAATVAQVGLASGGQNAFVPNLGASGAVAGVLGAYLVMFPRRRVLTLVMFFFITTIYLPAFLVLGLWFVLQAFNGLAQLSPALSAGGGVAYWAHIGGFAFGAILALVLFPKERFAAEPPPDRGIWGQDPRTGTWRRRRGRYDEGWPW